MHFVVDAAAWAVEHWHWSLGLTVVLIGPWLVVRAWRRADEREAERQTLTETDRADFDDARDRRGRRIEDLLTLVVASAAAYLSSTGLRKFGRDLMGLHDPLDWLPFIGLDLAALVCGFRARRRARQQLSPGLSGALFWGLLVISSIFSAAEAQTVGEGAARAVWPLLSGILFELGSLEERRSARDREKRSVGQWVDRRMAAVRMLHPVEWVRVQFTLAADESISQSVATRRVRVATAAHRLYRLRLLQDLQDQPDQGARRRFFGESRILRADRRARKAQAQLERESLPAMFELVQRYSQTRNWATLKYSSPTAAQKVIGQLIGMSAVAEAGTAQHGTRAADRFGTPPLTDTELSERHFCSGTDEPRTGTPGTEPVPERPVLPTHTGTAAVPVQARTGTETHSVPPRPETSVPPVPEQNEEPFPQAKAGTDSATEWKEEAIVEDLRQRMTHQELEGLGKIGRRYGIGTGKAKRVRGQAQKLGPLTKPDTNQHTPTAQSGTERTETGTANAVGAEGPVVIDLAKARPVPALQKGGVWQEASDLVLAGPVTTVPR